MAKVINQEFGEDWAFYNGDCVFVMAGLPKASIDFTVYSPPFAKLYIYSDSVADLGNSADESEFFEGFRFALRGLHRVNKVGAYHAVHCKDLMRYMSSHGYSGQDDFSGNIILAAEAEGWTFQRRVTIWKNPVIEMQRTKTYGLLHKSFATRAEVVRVGAPDYVLLFRKQDNVGEVAENWPMPELPQSVVERVKHIWTMPGEDDRVIYVGNRNLEHYSPKRINELSSQVGPGRLAFIRCVDIPRIFDGERCGYFDMAGEIIRRFEAQGNWKFHTRISLTDGSYLVGFRNWSPELIENYKELNGAVTHDLKAPQSERYFETRKVTEEEPSKVVYFDDGKHKHQDYVGNEPPLNWHDDSYYSILVWQKYASPVWNDLEGLPAKHANCWMNINQTNVLNFKAAKDPEDEKHICPLQLDLTERLILEYSKPGDVVLSPYGGISSEGYVALKLGRKAILAELKSSYWKQGVKYLKTLEVQERQMSLL
jgi:DNA modification methylase